MRTDVENLSRRLAADKTISDYDFWRAAKTINQALYLIERNRLPIPLDVIRAHKIILKARKKRIDWRAFERR